MLRLSAANLVALLLLCVADAEAQGEKPKAPGELTRLAEGVYADIVSPDSNAVSNSGIVVLDHSVLVFDTHFTPEAGQALAAKVLAVTTKPVRYIVLSHYHPDHTHGNQAFPGALQAIASTNARRDILQRDIPAMNRAVGNAQAQIDRIRKELARAKSPEQQEELRRQIKPRQDFLDRMARLKLTPPLIAFDDSLVITEGERSVELLSPGIGHTDGDIVLHLPAEKIVFAGDLFFNAALPNTQDGSMLEWIKTLAELLKLDAEQYVPGHGRPGTKEDVRRFRSYLEELKAAVEAGIQRGDSLEQVLRDCRIPPAYTSFQFQNFFPANVQKMYLELKALQPVAPATDETVKKTEPEKTKP